MAILTIDFETYYDKDYSLKKMTTVEYILDHRFQVIMCSFKLNDEPATVEVGYEAVRRRLVTYDWSKLALCAYHVRFDGSILAWHFGITPKLYLDPLSMARATTHVVVGRSSLAAVSKYLELPDKGDAVVRAIGKRLEDFTRSELEEYADYCNRDNENCYSIFTKLKKIFISTELRLIDLVARMHILPQVKLDPPPLAAHLEAVRARKQEILDRVSVDPEVFRSNPKFAALLESYGVDVPLKISPTTGQETYALAKGDREFKELCMDPEQPLEVQALLAARTSQKSTLEETRTQKLLDLSLLNWHHRGERWAVVPLKYSGARTHRLSGDDKTNWQNFARMSPIRAGIVAPPSFRIVYRDASQIEARMVSWLAKCQKLLRAFAEGRDVYCDFGKTVYGRVITKADTMERFVCKTGILGLGYGCGPPKFRHMLFIGNGGISVDITLEEATRIVYHYRSVEYPEIKALWHRGEHLVGYVLVTSRGTENVRSLLDIEYLARGASRFPVVKPGFDCLWLPNGLCLMYPNLRFERMPDSTTAMVYDNRTTGGYYKIYGGKAIENISQALSRIVVTDIAVRVFDLTGHHPFLSTHDSLGYCVHESEVEWWDRELDRQFAIRPTWAPDLPLASEGGWGRTLLAAEKKENT